MRDPSTRPTEPSGSAATPPAAAAPGRSLWAAHGVHAVLAVGLVAALVLLVSQARRLWFFGDDWEFLTDRGTLPGPSLGLFAPHNEHWSTVPILIYRGVFAVVGLGSFTPYMVPVLTAHLVICLVLFRLLRRFGASPWVSLGTALFIAFYGAGAEDTLWAFQIGFVGSVMFGLLAIAAIDQLHQGRLALVAGWVLLLLSLMSSGVGLAMVGATAVFVACLRGVRSALLHISVPVAGYVVWYLVFGRQASKPIPTSLETLPLVPQFVWTGLTAVFEKGTGIPSSGAAILLVVLAVACVRRVPDPRLRCLAWAGFAGALLHFTIAGVSRVASGVDQGLASRYLYLGAVLLAPALAVTLDAIWARVRGPRWAARWLVGAMAVFVLVNGVAETLAFRTLRGEYIGDLRDRLPAGVALVNSGAQVINDRLDQIYSPDVTVDLLRRPGFQQALPAADYSDASLLSASSNLQVAVTPKTISVPMAPGALALVGFVPATVSGPSCSTYAVSGTDAQPASLLLNTGTAGAQITYTGPATTIRTVLYRGDLHGSLTVWPVYPNQPVHIGSSMPGGTLEIRFNGSGRSTICLG